MNLLTWFLLSFLAVALAAVVFLFIRLRRKEADIQDVIERLPQSDSGTATYAKAALDQFLYDRCCKYMMEKRPFLVDGFTSQDLAGALYTNRAYLSKTINRFSGKNFRQYVNYYRVMYAMEIFRANPALRVMELSSLSGFRSVTSFYQSFKAIMKEPPSAWCARVRRKSLRRDKF